MACTIMNHHEEMDALEQRWPKDGLESVQACPVCGETRRETLYERLTDRVFFCAPGEWTLHRCLGCRSAYLDPRPTPDTIALAYRHYFTHESPQTKAAVKPKNGLAGLKDRLRNGYLNHRYNLTLQPASPLWRLAAPWFSIRRTGIDRWLRNFAAPYPGARLLDVGCGNGTFLRLASRMGWEVHGLEPDPSAAAAARSAGLQVQEGHLPDTHLPSDYFDAVILSHVIEHLHDPIRSLQEVYRILAPGGKLYACTPNLESPLHRRFTRHWRGLEPPRHLVLFNLRSLVSVCRRSGFNPVAAHGGSGSAAWITTASRNIECGAAPWESASKLALVDRLRALGLELGATFRPDWGEELGVIATKTPM
ncbi:class I SAM-dependent methyltransferase [Methylocaldum sp. RMAD-M]|uniref:class I SAM-dependent methyltransferase n=1 Tax=Methylocaldum sp. RMAD-M TaxID=2806557 RepID=UPI00143DF707|nr:class I SAM-dependent methyltransferase [Methylocaldum sp. RMAD-M]MBP1152812.1 SAM-dependent methyltransferase [Methylocaldum sp. RMAD-M]